MSIRSFLPAALLCCAALGLPACGQAPPPPPPLDATADKTTDNTLPADMEATHRQGHANAPQVLPALGTDPQVNAPALATDSPDPLAEDQARKEISQAKQLALACKLYAGDNDGKFPVDLAELYPTYLTSPDIFLSPFRPLATPLPVMNEEQFKEFVHTSCAYEYFGGKDEDPPETVLLRARYRAPDGMRTVVYITCAASRVR